RACSRATTGRRWPTASSTSSPAGSYTSRPSSFSSPSAGSLTASTQRVAAARARAAAQQKRSLMLLMRSTLSKMSRAGSSATPRRCPSAAAKGVRANALTVAFEFWMKSQAKHFWAMLALLIVGGAVVNFWSAAGEARVPRRALAEFPSEVGGWRQVGRDERFDAATEAVLRADDSVSREYAADEGGQASLYVGLYLQQRTGATYH